MLEGPLTTLAFCWRLDRRDGVALGFTSHDRDLTVDGMTYRAAPGIAPSAITLSDGLEADTLDVGGALSADAITAEDLASGRWDGARVRLLLADWADPAAPPLLLTRGELGAVERRDLDFAAELRGPAALLDRPAAETTSPDCRAALGDRRCRVDLADRRRIVRVSPTDAAERLVADAGEPSANAYAYGRLRWLSGPNGGLASAILASDGPALTLREPPAFAVAAGTLAEVTEGCDRRLETCRDRFANVANFRGEPHLPGTDLLTRYPGG